LIQAILAAEELIASRISRTLRTYPRQITAVIGAALLCAGGGAFAVASLGDDPADMPVHQVLEAVKPFAATPQTEALESHDFTLFRTEITRSSDTAEALLKRLGISDPAAAAFVRGNAQARGALLSRSGRTITAEAARDNSLRRLIARWIPDGSGAFKRLVVARVGNGFTVQVENEQLVAASKLASGIVRTSLFAATDDAGIPDAVASQLADVFDGAIDFRALRKGDRFAVVYETFEADGQALRTGRVLSAEIESGSKTHQAIWFQEPGQKGAYYQPDGKSLAAAYLASPVEFSRISSGFAMRLHPILNSWRQHKGTDFAAPTGTAVRTVGDGVVEFAGTQSGYGNMIVIKHRGNQETAYAHLSRIDVKVGQSVSQGQFIGAVGSTGWATGPHLHFEFRVNGEQADPATLAQQTGGTPLSAAARPAFERLAVTTRIELAAAFSVVQASAD